MKGVLGVISVFVFFLILGALLWGYKTCRGFVTPLTPEIHGITPAVIYVPSYPYGYFSIEAEGAIKVEFPTDRPTEKTNLVYIPGLGKFRQGGGRIPGYANIIAISCTASNWSPTKPGAETDSCLNPVKDPQKQVRFTIREVR